MSPVLVGWHFNQCLLPPVINGHSPGLPETTRGRVVGWYERTVEDIAQVNVSLYIPLIYINCVQIYTLAHHQL